MFSLAKRVFTSLFLDSTLLVGETETVVLVEAILGKEKSYPKPVQLEANFLRLSISSSFAVKVLSNWALTWNNSTSSFLVFSAKKLFSNSTLLVGETKIVVLVEAILGEEKSFPKPIWFEAVSES